MRSESLLGIIVGGRYRVESLIGEGGLCYVYRAVDARTEKHVALKVLPAARAQKPELASRFQREITTGKRIVHPNVTAISDSGTLEDGALFLVMELLEGRSLDEVLERGRLEAGRAVALARQLLGALGVAHKLGITHRDVKPENIFLVDVGGVETVKLLDFGIALNDRAAVKLTAAGVAFGTPEYISPEMAMGLPVDPRADLYSVGVVLFQMVAGRLPFPEKEPARLLKAHVNDQAPRARAVAPDANIPPALDAAIARALEKLPSARFPSAEEMIAALDAAASGPRSRAPALVAAAIALAIVGVGVWFWIAHREPEVPPPEPPPSAGVHAPPPPVRRAHHPPDRKLPQP
jgi:serine/threonine-protein kinase